MISTDSRRLQKKNRSNSSVLLSSAICPILLAMFFFLALATPPLEAEAREEKGSINFPLVVDVDASGNKRWILLPLTDESQVEVEDNEARTIVLKDINKLLKGKISPEVQKKSSHMNFEAVFRAFSNKLENGVEDTNLKMSFGKVKISNFNNVDEGLEVGTKETLKVPLKLTISIPLQSLNLVLVLGDKEGDFDLMTIGTIGELTTTSITEDFDLNQAEKQTVVSVKNFINLTDVEINELKPQLAHIAVELFNHAKAGGMIFGSPPPRFGEEDHDLDKRFRFPDSNNVAFYMEESEQQDFSHILTLGFLEVVREIDIQHKNTDYVEQADKLIAKLQESLLRVWTREFDEELRERLLDDRRVERIGKISINDGVYLIEPYLGGQMFDGSAIASAGVTYSTEKQWAATASAAVSNLSGRNEKTSIGAELGEEIGKANIDFSLPYSPYRSYSGRLKDSTSFVKAAYDRDKEQQYELVKADQEVKKIGIGQKFIWNSLDSKQQGKWGQTTLPDRKKTRFITSLKLNFDYEDWHFHEQEPDIPLLNDGQYGIVKLGFMEDMAFDFRRVKSRFQELIVPVQIHGQYGFDINGDNDDYAQFTFAVQGKFYFRWMDEKDVNFSLSLRGGISDDETPVFKQFKIGNRDTVRGLESGEIIANSYSLQSIEMGVSLTSLLWPLFGKNDQYDDSNQTPLLGQLEMVNLEVFYDRGSVSQDESFPEMFKLHGDLEGYGINFSIEVPLNDTIGELEIGYAYSPDSEMHSSGLFYTRLDANIW